MGFPTRIRRLIVTITSVRGTSEPYEGLAERFAGEAGPVFDVLSRGARRVTRWTPTPRTYCKTHCWTHTRVFTHTRRAPTSRHGSSGFSTTAGSARTSADSAVQRRFPSRKSPNGIWPVAPRAPLPGCAPPRRKFWKRCPAARFKQRCTICRRASGQRCTTPTYTATATRRPPRF